MKEVVLANTASEKIVETLCPSTMLFRQMGSEIRVFQVCILVYCSREFCDRLYNFYLQPLPVACFDPCIPRERLIGDLLAINYQRKARRALYFSISLAIPSSNRPRIE